MKTLKSSTVKRQLAALLREKSAITMQLDKERRHIEFQIATIRDRCDHQGTLRAIGGNSREKYCTVCERYVS